MLSIYYLRGEYMALLGGISFILLEGLVRLVTMVRTSLLSTGSCTLTPWFALPVYARLPYRLVS